MDRQPLTPAVGPRHPSLLSWRGWAAGVLLACAGGLGCNPALPPAGPPKPPEVEVSLAISREVTDYEIFTGRLEAHDSVELRSRVGGYLMEAPFKQGANVEKGTSLFKIDPSTYQAALDQADASVAEAEAKVKAAEFNVEAAKTQLDVQNDTYARDLRSPAATTAQDLIRDKNNVVVADANLKVAQATLVAGKATVTATQATRKGAQLSLDFTDVVAPLSGRISRRLADPGNSIQADVTPLATIVSLDPIYAYFDVDERTILRVRRLIYEENKLPKVTHGDVNLPVFLGLSDEQDYPRAGKVIFGDNREDPQTGTLRVWGQFDNPTTVLSPGMFARIKLPLGTPHSAVLMSEEALVTDQGRKLLYVIQDTVDDNGQVVKDDKGRVIGQASARYVKIGSLQNGLRVIEDGLKAGEKVVVNGLQRVQDKAKVTIKNELKLPENIAPNAEPAAK